MTFKSLFAWIAKLFTHTSNEETKMSEDLIQSGVATATVLIAADVPAIPAAPILATPAAADAPAVAATPAIAERVIGVDGRILSVDQRPLSVTPVNTDTLKALLLTLGHDIEAEWEHVVALAKKAL